MSEKPPETSPHVRRTTWAFTKHILVEGYEAILLLAVHALVVSVALYLGSAIQSLHHVLHDPHAVPTFGDQAIDFGIHFAERILSLGLIIVGTFSALWTFVQRRRE